MRVSGGHRLLIFMLLPWHAQQRMRCHAACNSTCFMLLLHFLLLCVSTWAQSACTLSVLCLYWARTVSATLLKCASTLPVLCLCCACTVSPAALLPQQAAGLAAAPPPRPLLVVDPLLHINMKALRVPGEPIEAHRPRHRTAPPPRAKARTWIRCMTLQYCHCSVLHSTALCCIVGF